LKRPLKTHQRLIPALVHIHADVFNLRRTLGTMGHRFPQPVKINKGHAHGNVLTGNDPVRIALQRDFRDQGPVLAMPGKVRGSTWWPAPSRSGTTFSQHQPPTNPQCTNTNLLITRLLYFWASCSPISDVYLWSRRCVPDLVVFDAYTPAQRLPGSVSR
jgi:hypothetical protein